MNPVTKQNRGGSVSAYNVELGNGTYETVAATSALDAFAHRCGNLPVRLNTPVTLAAAKLARAALDDARTMSSAGRRGR